MGANVTVLEWNTLLEPGEAPHSGRTLRPSQDEDALPSLSEGLAFGPTLGEGGMAIVRSALQGGLGRTVACKTLRPEQDTPQSRRRLLREAWVTGALEHPNVVPVYAVGEDEGGRPYLLMRRIEGEPWSKSLAQNRGKELDQHLGILLQVCHAVGFAHARGVLHRDLKPDNVMIGQHGEVYVLDWGLAVGLPGCQVPGIPLASDQRGIAGTPAYLAPEQLGGELSERTDIYLLGGLLYEILHGHPPRPADVSGPSGVEAVLEQARTEIPALDPSLSSDLRTVLEGALALRPQDRHASVDIFRAALHRAIERRGAMALLARAEADLRILEQALYWGAPAPDVLTRLGACRFGFARVLEAIPDFEPARHGLDRALCAAASWELGRGDWGAAELLLAEAHEVPEPLALSVSQAREQALAQQDRARKLDDHVTGVRTRAAVMILAGIVWALGPLVGFVLETYVAAPTHGVLVAVAAGILLQGLLLARWGQESLSATDINRKIRFLLVTPPLLQLVGAVGSWMIGLSPEQTQVSNLVPWGALALCYGAFFDRSFLWVGAAYLAAYLFSARLPALTLLAVSAANVLSVGNVLRMAAPHLRARWLAHGPAHSSSTSST